MTSLERSLDFYRGLLEPLGYVRVSEIVDERAAWLRERGAVIESGPEEYDYAPGYYAVFFYDPDRIKLEIVHRPAESDLVAEVRRLTARLERLEREGS
ncbi:MAG: hypothetical protein QOI64_2427 [Solirubrobacteraceae bacterium]|nr:hypothetical protein [Solirubrobacteraceae bacterium]